MKLITKRPWEIVDYGKPRVDGRQVEMLPAGEHEVEVRTVSPFGRPFEALCLKGTSRGASLNSFLQWAPGQVCTAIGNANFGRVIDWEDFEVRVIDDAGNVMPAPTREEG